MSNGKSQQARRDATPACMLCGVEVARRHRRPRLLSGLCARCWPALTRLEREMFDAILCRVPPERVRIWEESFAGMGSGPEREAVVAFTSGALARRVRIAA